MFLCVCWVVDHRRQTVVRISVTHSAIASCATFLFLQQFDVICDLLQNRGMATWNLFVKYIRNKHFLPWWSKSYFICWNQKCGKLTESDSYPNLVPMVFARGKTLGTRMLLSQPRWGANESIPQPKRHYFCTSSQKIGAKTYNARFSTRVKHLPKFLPLFKKAFEGS